MRIVSTPEIITVKLGNTAIFKAEEVAYQYLIKLFYTNIFHLSTYYFMDRNDGVVNNLGRVYNGTETTITDPYPDFYVADGGVVPTFLGVNSSLTISALAFRIAENIVGSVNFLPVEPVTIGTDTIYFSK
jgi:hypothetical protein